MEESSNEMLVMSEIHGVNTEDEGEKTNKENLEYSLPPPDGRFPLFYFGCGPFHPGWLQVLADPKVYTFVLCLFGVVEVATVSGETAYRYL